MTPSPTLRAIQAETAPHMARCGKLTVHLIDCYIDHAGNIVVAARDGGVA